MKTFTTFGKAALVATLLGSVAMPAFAETPPNMLVIANRIDDIKTFDPAESFEFAGADVSRNVYEKLVNFDPLDLDAYPMGSGEAISHFGIGAEIAASDDLDDRDRR